MDKIAHRAAETDPGRIGEPARNSLRQQQIEDVRAALRQAFIGLVLERGGLGFSLHDVAARAGVSDRTLYRHYPSRESLVEAVTTEEVARLEAERRAEVSDVSLEGDTDRVADVFELFERHADLMRALRMLRASGAPNPASSQRTRQVRAEVASHGVHPAAVEQLTGLVRLIVGADSWARLRESDLDLDGREAGYAAHWAVQVLVKAAQETQGALRPTPEW